MKKLYFKIYSLIYHLLSGKGLRKISFLQKINDYLSNNITYVEAQGHKMVIDPHYKILATQGVYDKFETDFYKTKIQNNDVVIDIGANIGYFSLLFAKLVGKNGKVFAFEPDPNNFTLLTQNIQLNNYQNITAENSAVSNKTTTINLFLSPTNPGDHRIYDSNDGRKSIQTDSIILDNYFLQKKIDINFIKIDVQGSELPVILGMKKLLESDTIKIMIEYEPILLEKFGTNPPDLLNVLQGYGFNFFDVSEIEQKIIPVSVSELISKYNSKNGNRTNLFLEK